MKTKRVKAINNTIESLDGAIRKYSKKKIDGIDYNTAWSWQYKCFHETKDSLSAIINSVMGSGKSTAIFMNMFHKLETHPNMIGIIAAPDHLIMSSFKENYTCYDDKLITFEANENMYLDGDFENGSIKSNVISLNKGLMQRVDGGTTINNRIFIVTHATITRLFSKLKDSNQLHLFKNVHVCIDEVHRACGIKGVENKLGKLIRYLRENKCSHLLTTATLFRGDKGEIIPSEHLNEYAIYKHSMLEYFQGNKWLKSFCFDYLLYPGANYSSAFDAIDFGKKGRIRYFSIPHPNSNFSIGGVSKKLEDRDLLLDAISEGKGIEKIEDYIIYLNNGRIVVDLIDPDETKRKYLKKFLHDNSHVRGAFTDIIAINMFKEGANHDHINEVFIFGARTSIKDIVQMGGRGLRDALRKSTITINYVIPALTQVNKEKLNTFLVGISLCMLLENIYFPKISFASRSRNKSGNKNSSNKYQNIYGQIGLSDTQSQDIIVKATHKMVEAESADKELTFDQFENFVCDIVNKKIPNTSRELTDDLATTLWVTATKTDIGDKFLIDIEKIDIDLVKKAKPIGIIDRFTSKPIKTKVFKHLKSKMKEVASLEEIQAFIRSDYTVEEWETKRIELGFAS